MKKLLLLVVSVFVLSITISAQNIVKLEYSVNEFVTEGNGTTIALPGNSEEVDFSFNIDISNLDPGVHTIFLRTQNEDGVWSFMERRGFYIPKPVDTYEIVAYEYLLTEFDTEGEGEMTILESGTTLVDTLFNIDVTNLDNGIYDLYFRAKNNVGYWSQPEKRTLFIQRPDTTKVDKIHYRFFTDNDNGTWSQTDLTPDELLVDSIFMFNASGIDISVPVSLEVFAENTKSTRGYSVFLNNFNLRPNSAPTALLSELLAEMYMGTVLNISMDTLFNDDDIAFGDRLSFQAMNYSSTSIEESITWLEDGIMEIKPAEEITGSFTFTIEASDLFSETVSLPVNLTIVLDDTSSNTHLAENGIKVYPNPADGVLFIENNLNLGNGVVEVIDVQGQVVRTVSLINLTRIDISDLENGIYFVRIENGDRVFHRKVVVQ
jgi:hypothetical protein